MSEVVREQPPRGWRGLHHRLYDWVMHWSGHRHARPALFSLALAEASVFPLPPDMLLVAMSLSKPQRAMSYALICTVGSVVGGFVGYAIGWGLWEAVADLFYHYVPGFSPEVYARVSALYERWNFWVVFIAGFTPIPYKIFTIAAGVSQINLATFLLASALGRSARFFMVAGLVGWFGPKVKPFIERYLGWLTIAFVVMLLAGFWALGLLRH